jgi:Flp pilus assembly pilin Flp
MTHQQLVPTRPYPARPAPSGGPSSSLALAPRALAARAHHGLLRLRDGERGQGTVEYVALAMLIAAIMVGVVSVAGTLRGGGIAQAVVEKVKSAIGAAGAVPPKGKG